MTNPNDPAFPPKKFLNVNDNPIMDQLYDQRGLTKREYFAGLAMQGIIIVGERLEDKPGAESRVYVAQTACKLADALIAELSKELKK
jgi:hypothetical protein